MTSTAAAAHCATDDAAPALSVAAAARSALAIVFGADFLALPVHAGGALVVDLHAIHADVALAGLGIAGDDAGQGDEAAGILRPALQDGEIERARNCRAG